MTVTHRSFAASLALAGACAVPLAAQAQAPSYATRGETIRGTIASVENVNHLFVSDDRGYTDDVTLRPGTAVFSNGVRLVPGERVTIQGSAAGPTFMATRIATNGPSYSSAESSVVASAPAYYPAPVYYPAPIYYSAGYYGYPYVSAFFGFGGYGRYGGYRGYRGYGGYRGGYHSGIGIGVRIR